jgi:hypothetical protein
MYKQKPNTDHAFICNFMPGYAYYSSIGSNLAEQLVNLVEWIIGLRR